MNRALPNERGDAESAEERGEFIISQFFKPSILRHSALLCVSALISTPSARRRPRYNGEVSGAYAEELQMFYPIVIAEAPGEAKVAASGFAKEVEVETICGAHRVAATPEPITGLSCPVRPPIVLQEQSAEFFPPASSIWCEGSPSLREARHSLDPIIG